MASSSAAPFDRTVCSSSEDFHDKNLVTEIESLCMKCGKNGISRLLLVNIPHFKELILSSFECSHCGYANRESQTGAALNERGACRIELKVTSSEDLNRQIIKAEAATLMIVELELEVPPTALRGSVNTVEGLLMQIANNLQCLQDERHIEAPDIASKIDSVIHQLKDYASEQSLPFTVVVDDPTGNSYIERLPKSDNHHIFPNKDSNLNITWYERTEAQLIEMGHISSAEHQISSSQPTKPSLFSHTHLLADHMPNQLKLAGWNLSESAEDNISRLKRHTDNNTSDLEAEGISFSVQCPHCGKEGSNEMCCIDIPGFRKCLIMSFVCSYCGSRSNEVKPMGAYGSKAKRWTLHVACAEDLNRDVLKSDTAEVTIPEVELTLTMGTLGGVFTTVEGLIVKIIDQLKDTNQLFSGDSGDPERRKIFENLLHRLNAFITDLEALPFTLIIDDAADLSTISRRCPSHSLCDNNNHYNDQLDTSLTIVEYERTEEQNDELGISTMKTENYDDDDEKDLKQQ